MNARFLAGCLAVLLAAAPAAGADAGGRDKELKRIKRAVEEKKRAIRKAKKRERSILADIERIDRTVQEKRSELARERQLLRDAERDLALVEQGAAVLQRDLQELQRAYRARVRALYKQGRSGPAVAVLTAENLSAAAKRARYLLAVAAQDRRIIADYRVALGGLEQRRDAIAERTAEIARRQDDIRSRQDELAGERRKRSAVLASVRKETELSRQLLDELEESSRSLWEQIKAEQEERRKAAAAAKQAPPAARATGRGSLPWPVSGTVVSSFGQQKHPQFGTPVFRRGIEIEVREGTPVRSVKDGTAVYADWQKGYGMLLIVEHGRGLYSLYGHLSRLDARKGDPVSAGQVVGLAGDTGSLRGSRLYFEIRRNGVAEDPLRWLAKR